MVGTKYDGSFCISTCQSSPPPHIPSCYLTPYLRMGGRSLRVAPIALLHSGLSFPSLPVLPSCQPPQRLTLLISQSRSHCPLLHSDVITFALGFCSNRIPRQVAVHILVSINDTHGTNMIYLLFCLL